MLVLVEWPLLGTFNAIAALFFVRPFVKYLHWDGRQSIALAE